MDIFLLGMKYILNLLHVNMLPQDILHIQFDLKMDIFLLDIYYMMMNQ